MQTYLPIMCSINANILPFCEESFFVKNTSFFIRCLLSRICSIHSLCHKDIKQSRGDNQKKVFQLFWPAGMYVGMNQ